MRRDALIYQPLSRVTEFRYFAVGFRRARLLRCKLRHFPGRTPAHASKTGPRRLPAASGIESLVAKIAANPFTGCKGGLGIISQRDARASRE